MRAALLEHEAREAALLAARKAQEAMQQAQLEAANAPKRRDLRMAELGRHGSPTLGGRIHDNPMVDDDDDDDDDDLSWRLGSVVTRRQKGGWL